MAKTKLFIRKSYLNSKGEATIYVRYSHQDRSVDFSTGERIPPQYWDDANQRVRKSFNGFTGINNFIEKKKLEIDNIRLDLKTRKIEPTIEALKKEYLQEEVVVEEKSNFIFDHWTEFINYKKNVGRRSDETLAQYEVSKRVFESFEKFIGCRLTFEMITQSFIDDFISYGYGERLYAPNSIGGKIKHLKAFMEWASSIKELTSNLKYKKFKKPTNETNIIVLTRVELDHLFQLDLSNEKRLERAKDLFLLGCTTGLRFSDYSVLVSANFKDDYIVISTEKMDKQVRIPLNKYSRSIIAKYPNGLPTISNTNLNKYIKEVGIKAKFFEEHEITSFKKGIKVKYFKPLYSLLTSHCARRTFATQSLQRGMQMVDVMKVTGHQDIRSFMRYVKVSEPRLKEEIQRAWD